MKNEQNVPQVRFKGFTDAWEQREFSKQYVKVSEKNDLSFGTDKIISVANMYFKEDTKESSDDYMKTYNVMRLGDIAFEGNKSKNFAHGRFVENTIGDGIVSHVFDVFRPIADYDLLFWKYIINNEGVMGRIMTRCTKASTMMTNLVADDFLKEKIAVPSLEEQRQIGSFLNGLDNLITLHQRKCETLQKLKKSMLQKMFPKNGSLYPEIRFAGFTDAWEQREFGKMFKRRMERNNGQFDNTRWISVAKMYFQEPDKVTSNNIDTRTYVMRRGDIAFEGHSNAEYKYGRFVANDIGDGVISELFPIYMHIDDYDESYWKYAIQIEEIMAPKLLKCIEISYTSSNKLDEDFFLKESVLVPNIAEQEAIGSYFRNLDHLITLHQRKLKTLKKMKKSMLQKMFI